MDLEKFACDFICKLDAGEFDGRVIEVAGKLSREQLTTVIGMLVQREHRKSTSSQVSSGYAEVANS